MRPSVRTVIVVAVGLSIVAGVAFFLVDRFGSSVKDPVTARCPHPPVTTGAQRTSATHREVDVRFTCEHAVLAGTIYLPNRAGPHPGVVWVHGAGKAARLGWGGQILPGLVQAGVAVLSYDKRGAGQSQGVCCPGDDGHFNLLTADVVGRGPRRLRRAGQRSDRPRTHREPVRETGPRRRGAAVEAGDLSPPPQGRAVRLRSAALPEADDDARPVAVRDRRRPDTGPGERGHPQRPEGGRPRHHHPRVPQRRPRAARRSAHRPARRANADRMGPWPGPRHRRMTTDHRP